MKEHQIRPKDLYQKYIQLIETDAKMLAGSEVRVSCPGCGNKSTNPLFEKQGFIYDHCGICNTFFCNPRPSFENMEMFYRETESARYWNDVFCPAVEEIRRTQIYAPRVKNILNFCRLRNIRLKRILDIGAGNGIFLEEFRKQIPNIEICAIDPGTSAVEKCREKGFQIYQTMAEHAQECQEWADLVVSFEVLEHVHDPLGFINGIVKCLAPDGIALITTLNHEGLDLRLLRERSSQVLPPLHINFLSATGFRNLFARAGFSFIEILTPGMLDVNILENALADNILERTSIDPFLDWLIYQADNEIKQNFQNFLANFGMSSHIWVWARK